MLFLNFQTKTLSVETRRSKNEIGQLEDRLKEKSKKGA